MTKKTFNVYFNTEEGTFISERKPENLFESKMDDVVTYEGDQFETFLADVFCEDVPNELKFLYDEEVKLIVSEYVEAISPHRNVNYLTNIITIYYE